MTLARWWIGLGANTGDRRATLQRAVDALRARGVEVEAVAGIWETAPRDLEDQPAFLNSAVRARSALSPPEMLALVKDVERDLGRKGGGVRFGPRPIDCDLLVWDGGTWASAGLRVPHERLTQRRFAMLPVLDLDPDLLLPGGRALGALCAAIDPGAQPAARWEGPGLV